MRKIYFRADAGTAIGYGHFVRSLALADMLKDDFECIFVTQSPTEYQKSEVAKVCELIEVPATDAKFGMFLNMLDGNEIVVLDNYFYDTDYQRAIKAKGCKLVCIDDMHDKYYVADVVINHGLTDTSLFSVEPYTRLCLGVDWALLRAPFLQEHLYKRNHNQTNLHCIVNFGGVDYSCFTEKVVMALEGEELISRITAVIGEAHSLPGDLCFSSKVSFYRSLSAQEMCDLFLSGDFAVLSASTVALEARACNLPLIVGYYVENQKEIYQSMLESGIIGGIGDLREGEWRECLHGYMAEIKKRSMSVFPSDIKKRYIQMFHDE